MILFSFISLILTQVLVWLLPLMFEVKCPESAHQQPPWHLFNIPPFPSFLSIWDQLIHHLDFNFSFYQIHALITGPFDTPYEGGFFLFLFRCPPDYPIHPPRVKLITTGHNTVRFNPNFYRNGKVCLSILGWVRLNFIPTMSL